MGFVHLHTHSEYSLLDGANRIPELVDHVQRLGMDSLAITDHGNMHGAWNFYEAAKAKKLRPILGFEAYLAYGDRRSSQKPADAPSHYSHLVLLARNKVGYQNLIRLTSIGFTEGFYRRPRIDKEVLAAHADGVICLAACLSGEVAHALRADRYDEARRSAEWFARLFGPNGFWLEIQDHGIGEERKVQDGMLALARDLGLPVVATNDAHYLKRDDAAAHDVLLAIGTGADLDDPNRFRFTGEESYVKSEAEMRQLFPNHPEALANTAKVAELCEFDFEKRYFLPSFPRAAGAPDDNTLLTTLAEEGAVRRYGEPLPPAVAERIGYELSVITKAGYAGYFLIVQDFIAAARERGIPVGPGRGSAAGSIVAYSLGITDVCPLKFDLLFERFLNPERVSMPDIDVDFCFERRGEVIEYVRERYGKESVGQIVTFGTMKARAAVKDVARVLKIPPIEADRITKLIPSGPAYSLSIPEAIKKVPELAELVRGAPLYQRMANLASRIEGISRHLSVHAAGVVIAPGPLPDYVPVCTAPTKGAGQTADGEHAIITQYDMIALEKVGMLKMDLLGLKTLTVIHDAVGMIKDRHGTTVDMSALSLDDPKVYALLRQGRTAGVFQFESPLATDTLRQMKCDRFDDLVASNALLRPGPLDTGMHLVFIKRKLGQEPVSYPHPSLIEILEPTYGVITYQEQVMRIANVLAGFSLAEADVLRKAVGKKDAELIKKELGKFVDRGTALGHPKRLMEELAGQIETFGRYGFNKSHSVAYSVLSYQTAWLKTYYPAEFMAALLSSEIGDTDKVVQYINEARDLGLEVLPPDVNESGFKFTVVGDQRIRFGLGAVRNVGRGAIESIIAACRTSRITTLRDFVSRIDLRLCNKRVIESLIAAGACDELGGHRNQLMAGLDAVLGEAQLVHEERLAGQVSLFGDAPGSAPAKPAALPEVPEWSEAERLAREKELIGFFISGHPLAPFRAEVELFGTRTTATLGAWSEAPVTIGAVVTAVKRQISKKTGKEYARLVLEDFHGTGEAIVFPEAWATLNQTIVDDACLLLTGGYSLRDRGEDQAPFVVESAKPLTELRLSGALALAIRWNRHQAPPPDDFRAIAGLCASHPGPVRVYSGVLVKGSSVQNTTRGKREKIGRMVEMFAKEANPIEEARAGDIIALVSLTDTETGDTLSDSANPVILERMRFPEPVISVSVQAKSKTEQEKFGAALGKMVRADPSLRLETDRDTLQTILRGMGELHLEVTLDRMRTEFNVEGIMGEPQVAYRETITKRIDEQYVHKKQTGGSGQFAEVWITFEPQERSKGFEFVDATSGGSVPREYVPAVEKGLRQQMEQGVLAKFPTVDFKATLTDGSYHDVDSNALTFEIAAKACFREAIRKAGPILLEPVMKVETVTPGDYLGDVIGDINRRRGSIVDQLERGTNVAVVATVPLSEMFGYIGHLRGMTSGRASYTMEFSHYDPVPRNVADEVIEKASKPKV